MEISLTPELETFVVEKVESGRYQSSSEVMRAALRLLEEHDQTRGVQIAAFNQKLGQRLAAIERGKLLERGATPIKKSPVICEELESIKLTLQGRRYSAAEFPSSSGLYAPYLTDPAALSLMKSTPSGLLYVGMTGSSLAGRNHFVHKDSSSSSLRRSLGAILKYELNLQAIPRVSGETDTDMSHYQFVQPGEQRLTDWMNEHLTYGFAVLHNGIKDIEKELIAFFQPPLNLTDWPNPQKPKLRALRKACCDEANYYLQSAAGDERCRF